MKGKIPRVILGILWGFISGFGTFFTGLSTFTDWVFGLTIFLPGGLAYLLLQIIYKLFNITTHDQFATMLGFNEKEGLILGIITIIPITFAIVILSKIDHFISKVKKK